jgi:hypothetical protein
MEPPKPPALIVFDNQTSKSVFVQFLNGVFGPGQYGKNGQLPLSGDTPYNISDLGSSVPGFPELGTIPNISLNHFTNGRMYFNYGTQGLAKLGGGYQPSPNDQYDPNYSCRYSFIEPNVFGDTNNNMDLSALDFFSMPIEASTWSGGKCVHKLCSKSGGVIIQALTPIPDNISAFVPEKTPASPYTDFVRIIGPGLVNAYHDWTKYIQYLATLPYTTRIAGLFAGSENGVGATARQPYALEATFDAAKQQVMITGTAGGNKTDITIDFKAMNALTGIYGANPPFSVNGGPLTPGITNDVYGWIVGDLLAGMNMGFLGSSTKNPLAENGADQLLGQCTSSQWFLAAQHCPQIMFSGAQTNPNYYNAYAAALHPVTSAYGFPFTDRIGGVLLYFPPPEVSGGVDYLKITFLED